VADTNKTGLVITAHPGDFVWRAGGAIALHAKKGYRVKILCLSFGERGESQFAWKEKGATLVPGIPDPRGAEASLGLL
jgi:4-oxalomesaconate hydratase